MVRLVERADHAPVSVTSADVGLDLQNLGRAAKPRVRSSVEGRPEFPTRSLDGQRGGGRYYIGLLTESTWPWGFFVNVNNLTLGMVESYANACRAVHDYCGVLQKSGYDLLVVPSRGAHPFIRGAQSYSHTVFKPDKGELPIPGFVSLQQLCLPFTADLTDEQSATSFGVRRYWARVLAAILRGSSGDVSLEFHKHLRSVAGILAYGTNTLRNGTSDRFIFIDTVVSGRATYEIMAAFEECGLKNCHYLLLIDQLGTRMKTEYRNKINEMVSLDKATTIEVENIFTEVEGPVMSGIWTVTMPEVMESAKRILSLAGEEELVPTLFYCEVARRKDDPNLGVTVSNGKLSTLMHAAVNEVKDVTAMCLRDFLDHLIKNNLQRQSYTEEVAYPLLAENLPIQSTNVSSSHVIRAFVGQTKADKMIEKFLVHCQGANLG